MRNDPGKWRRILLRAALVGLAISTHSAGAENFVSNGEFDLDAFGWAQSENGQYPDWITLDHDDCGAASGSARFGNSVSAAETTVTVWTCVSGIVEGGSYSLSGFLRFPPGQARSGSASLYLLWLDGGTLCSGNGIGGAQTEHLYTEVTDSWNQRLLANLTAPAGAEGALLEVRLYKHEAGGTLNVTYDGIRLVEGHGYLHAEDFESDSLCRWSEVSS